MLPVWFIFKVCCQLLIWVRFNKSTSCSTALLGVPAVAAASPFSPARRCVACVRPPATLKVLPFQHSYERSTPLC